MVRKNQEFVREKSCESAGIKSHLSEYKTSNRKQAEKVSIDAKLTDSELKIKDLFKKIEPLLDRNSTLER
jgi:hypothetical protein